jgi:hypothetical protein
MPIAALAAPVIAGLGDLGLGAGLAGALGTGLVGAGLGAAGGGILGEIEGSKNIGEDILGGTLGGGITGGFAGPLGSALGSPLAGGALAGVGGGLANAAVTGGNPGIGALTGGALGAVTSGFGGGASSGTSGAGGGSVTGGASAASLAGGGASPFSTAGDIAAFSGDGGTPLGASATGLGTAGGELTLGGSVPAGSFNAVPAGFGGAISASSIQPLASSADLATAGGDTGLPVAGVGTNPSLVNDPTLASLVAAAPFDTGDSGVTAGTAGTGLFGFGGSTTALTPAQLPAAESGSLNTFGSDSSIWNWIKANPGLLLGGGLLGYTLLEGNPALSNQQALQNLAGQAQEQAAALAAPATTGVLPAGEQAAVRQAVNASKGGIVGTYGNLGLAGSTMEAEALQGANLEGAALTGSIANNLLSQSAQFTGLAGSEYNAALQSQIAQDAALRQALASFAGGLAGLRIPQATT